MPIALKGEKTSLVRLLDVRSCWYYCQGGLQLLWFAVLSKDAFRVLFNCFSPGNTPDARYDWGFCLILTLRSTSDQGKVYKRHLQGDHFGCALHWKSSEIFRSHRNKEDSCKSLPKAACYSREYPFLADPIRRGHSQILPMFLCRV